MIRASLALRNSDAKNKAASIAAKAVGRADLGTPAAKPSATSAPETTMMPWDGWFSSFLKDKLGDDKYDRLRRLVLYRPDDYTNFEQQPRPNTKLGISERDPTLTHQFRHPSPGSQPPVEQPVVDPTFGNAADDPYDSTYYKRDTGRRDTSDPAAMNREVERVRLGLLPQDDPRVKEALEEFDAGPGSSPGNKGVFATGPSDFDKTGGLRASMSTNFETTEASLDANMPDHVSCVCDFSFL